MQVIFYLLKNKYTNWRNSQLIIFGSSVNIISHRHEDVPFISPIWLHNHHVFKPI